MSGSAELTSGITSDSVGIRLGPGVGSVRVPLERMNVGDDFTLEVLVAGSGTLKLSLPSFNLERTISLSEDYEWQEVEGSFPSTYNYQEETVELTLSVGNGSSAEIADLRAQNLDYVHGCSVSGVGHR